MSANGNQQDTRPRVVIIGGGFGGLYCARALARLPVQVTLLDRRNHHLFQPLLYQVATAALNPSDIAQPIRAILRKQSNVEVLMAEVTSVDAPGRRVLVGDGKPVPFDYLVVATGATHSYFGHDEWQKRAPGLKTLEDAIEIRKRILSAFEEAERAEDPAIQQQWLTFVIVGGGPTGVELAGAIAEVSFTTLKRDFRRIDPSRARVILLEGSPNLLAAYAPELQLKAVEQLRKLGVDVRTSRQVSQIDDHGVTVAGEHIAARTVLWGAGVAASPLAKSLGAPLDKAGRVLVTPTLNVPGSDRIFVIGDLAAVHDEHGQLVPGVAPAAMQEGTYVAQLIEDLIHDKPVFGHPFKYFNKGSLATIGRRKAIAELPGGLKLWGAPAWLTWLFIHVLFLVGFRNRLLVLIEWAWAYLTFQRGARLITGPAAQEQFLGETPSKARSIGDTVGDQPLAEDDSRAEGANRLAAAPRA
jgi:NADH:ubiquinone reductase (H+-translocating)